MCFSQSEPSVPPASLSSSNSSLECTSHAPHALQWTSHVQREISRSRLQIPRVVYRDAKERNLRAPTRIDGARRRSTLRDARCRLLSLRSLVLVSRLFCVSSVLLGRRYADNSFSEAQTDAVLAQDQQCEAQGGCRCAWRAVADERESAGRIVGEEGQALQASGGRDTYTEPSTNPARSQVRRSQDTGP